MLNRRLLLCAAALVVLPASARAADPFKIVFLDTGNTGRSLMAETLARAIIARQGLPIAVISRGVDADPFDEAPEPNAQALMAERGFDVSAHRARLLTAQDVAHADLILTMTTSHAVKAAALFPDARAKIMTLALYATGADEAIPDAYGKPMPVYRAVVAQLDRLLRAALVKAASANPK